MNSAVISIDGVYRYRLMRYSHNYDPLVQHRALFVMMNPNTADDVENDPTIRRCMEFAWSWGYNTLAVGNLFAFRAADPKAMRQSLACGFDCVGPENDDHLRAMARFANLIVCAWGSNADRYEERVEAVCKLLRAYRPLHLIARTKHGGPAHPLYLHSSLKPQIYMEQHEHAIENKG